MDPKPGPLGSKACTHWICCETYSGCISFLPHMNPNSCHSGGSRDRGLARSQSQARRRVDTWEPGPVGGGASAGRAAHSQVCGPGDACSQGPSLPLMLVLLTLLPHEAWLSCDLCPVHFSWVSPLSVTRKAPAFTLSLLRDPFPPCHPLSAHSPPGVCVFLARLSPPPTLHPSG